MQERIQKILSKCGIASRRKAEEMMIEGRVTVNGAVATPGMKADFLKDHIKVDRKLIRRAEPKVYLMLNKPVKCVTALKDPEERTTVKDYMKGVKATVFPVGRLDYNSEGLLIMTNDGELANAVLHPKHKVPKTYLVKVNGLPDDKDIEKLQKGIKLEDGITAPAKVRRIRETDLNSWIEITIYEGKRRQIRRMLERIKHPVMRLRRTKVAGLTLGRLPLGSFRYLTPDEVRKLKNTVSH